MPQTFGDGFGQDLDEETLKNTDHKGQLNRLLQSANAAAGGGVSERAVAEVAEMVDSLAVDVMVDTARAQMDRQVSGWELDSHGS